MRPQVPAHATGDGDGDGENEGMGEGTVEGSGEVGHRGLHRAVPVGEDPLKLADNPLQAALHLHRGAHVVRVTVLALPHRESPYRPENRAASKLAPAMCWWALSSCS